jgi:hypothetical protein
MVINNQSNQMVINNQSPDHPTFPLLTLGRHWFYGLYLAITRRQIMAILTDTFEDGEV